MLHQLKTSDRSANLRSLSSSLRRQTDAPDYLVLQHLRKFMENGELECIGGIWKSASTTPASSSTFLPFVSQDTHEAIWSGKVRPCPEEEEDREGEPHASQGKWEKFRNLLRYYIQCVRNEEGADAHAYLNHLNDSFIFLRRSGFWQPRPGVRWQATIPLGTHLSNFIAQLPGVGDDSTVVLGYPLNASFKQGENGINVSVLRPVFLYPLQVEVVVQGLRLTIEDPFPEINLGWLEYAFSRKAGRQRNFLSACGFMRTRMPEDGNIEREKGEAAPNLDVLTSALSSFLPDKIRERLDLSDIPDMPLEEPFANGIYNRAVVMSAKRTRYSRRLLQELSIISNAPDEVLDSTALASIFTERTLPVAIPDENNSVEGVVTDVFPFNASQRQAVASLLQRDISVITGPPGTGKSQVVAGTAVNARFRGQSVLIASRNHKAIDAVVQRLVDPSGCPMVVRANSKEDPSLRYTFVSAIRDMLTAQPDYAARETAGQVLEDLSARLKERGCEADTAAKILRISTTLGAIESRLSYLHRELPKELPEYLDPKPHSFPAADVRDAAESKRFSNTGQKNSQISSWPGCRILFLYLRLRRRIKHIPGMPVLPFWPGIHGQNLLGEALGMLIKAAEYAELRSRAREMEIHATELPTLEEITERITRIDQRMADILPGLLTLDIKRRMGLRDEDTRAKLAGLRAALKSINTGLADGRLDGQAVREISSLGKEVLNASPIWAVTSLSVGSRLPFCPGLFDLALLDEASQSDIPSAIPILFRAKRVGVIGDPLQLTHTSRLSPAKDTLMRKNLNFERVEDQRFAYTESSLYDLCAGTTGVVPIFLDTTYRSAGDIAEYSSSLFYNGRLRVGTNSAKLNPPPGVSSGIHWTEIQGQVESAGGSGCHCPAEVKEIVRQVETLLGDGRYRGTLGIVTPFRQQANRIQDALYESGVNYQALQDAQMHIDTAHGFQGDERDVILFSLCGGPDMPRGSRYFLRETGNLFNVAVSRARAVLHVVGNRQWAARCGIPHIERLARPEEYRPPTPNKSPWYPHESPYEELLYTALVNAGLAPKPQYPVRYRRLDMALVRQGSPELKLDIEVDGDCHRNSDGSRKRDDLWRDIELKGMGWKVVRFWTYQLREDLPGCVTKIMKMWEQA
ncbi:AAA domain-containing protein [Desulfovibrio sp. Huiquan2017]|uniref:AAA domain-containing protein n=1 Tax=Desulfovibrio sp. Huiquan2017 TaxID=2816861 RepID=UPI001A91F45D|nr:AAA domain-containing protein [Desulfovibrio sp. Huiquan2017]